MLLFSEKVNLTAAFLRPSKDVSNGLVTTKIFRLMSLLMTSVEITITAKKNLKCLYPFILKQFCQIIARYLQFCSLVGILKQKKKEEKSWKQILTKFPWNQLDLFSKQIKYTVNWFHDFFRVFVNLLINCAFWRFFSSFPIFPSNYYSGSKVLISG